MVAAAFVRWRERAYFLVLLFVGLVLAVGPFPFTHPTAVGGVLKSFMTDTTAGLALRSTDRATPLVLLALSMLLGSGLTALYRRLTVVGIVTALAVAALVVANNPSLFNGDIIANNFTQPASLPAYEMAAIDHLNATHPGTRVFAIPGNDFASYRWGDTVDTPQSAYLNRDFVTREQQIYGSIATADTLYAVDRLSEGVLLAHFAELARQWPCLLVAEGLGQDGRRVLPAGQKKELGERLARLKDPHKLYNELVTAAREDGDDAAVEALLDGLRKVDPNDPRALGEDVRRQVKAEKFAEAAKLLARGLKLPKREDRESVLSAYLFAMLGADKPLEAYAAVPALHAERAFRTLAEDLEDDISDEDEPAIHQKNLRGEWEAWIEVGSPTPDRLHKAAKKAPRVAVKARSPFCVLGS